MNKMASKFIIQFNAMLSLKRLSLLFPPGQRTAQAINGLLFRADLCGNSITSNWT